MKKFPRRFSRIDAQGDWPGRDIAFDELYVKAKDGDDGKQRQSQFAVHCFQTSRSGIFEEAMISERGE